MEDYEGDLGQRIATATNQILKELGLSDRVTVTGVQPKLGSTRYAIGLTEQTAAKGLVLHHFYIDHVEVMNDPRNLGRTVEGLKRYVRREVEKLFPEPATQE